MILMLIENLSCSAICFQEHVKKSLLQHGIQLEDFGGDVQAIPISALKVGSTSQ